MKNKHQHRTKPNNLQKLFASNSHVQPESEEGHTAAKDQASAPPQPMTEHVQPLIVERHGSTRRLEFWVPLIISFFALIVITIHAYYYNKQWQTMIRQADLMVKQLESMNSSSRQIQDLIAATQQTANASQSVAEQNKELVRHTGEQAKASAIQANTSIAQVEVARGQATAAQAATKAAVQGTQVAARSMVLGSQAWITVQAGSLQQYVIGKPIIALLEFVNAGNTPAFKVRVAPVAETRNTPPDFSRAALLPKLIKVSTNIGPRVPINRTEYTNNPLDSKSFADVEAGKNRFYFYGLITWDDIFKQPHYTTYCFFYKPPFPSLVDCGGETH